jgi:starch synthase
MKIAMLSSEIAPFAKTGGLADVLGTLSPALEKRGHDISLIMPAYRSVLNGPFALDETGMQLAVPLGASAVEASILEARLGQNVSVYLVRADRYFDRDFLYGTPYGDYPDNAERFAFFCRAALEILRRHPAAIVHCHDWQTALGIVFLKAQGARYPEVASAKTVLTAHNLGFQGIFRESHWPLLNLDRSYFNP